jgi:hypothetical protein
MLSNSLKSLRFYANYKPTMGCVQMGELLPTEERRGGVPGQVSDVTRVGLTEPVLSFLPPRHTAAVMGVALKCGAVFISGDFTRCIKAVKIFINFSAAQCVTPNSMVTKDVVKKLDQGIIRSCVQVS